MKKKVSGKCPIKSWLNAKVCLPEGKRGIVVSQIIESYNHGFLVQISPDPVLSSLIEDPLESQVKLRNLPRGTFILLASHKMLGNKFWVVKTDQFIETDPENPETGEYSNITTYTVKELKELKNFIEVRKEERVAFSIPVGVLNSEDFSLEREVFTYDISQNGVSLFLNRKQRQEFEFELQKEYLLELRLHEASGIRPLRYTCVQRKEDHVTNSYIYGFSLNEEDALDQKVQYNLSFLTWSGVDLYNP